jgi:polysaccharide biosynthesis transport protein
MSTASVPNMTTPQVSDDIDVATLLSGVGRKKKWIILPTLAALLLSTAYVTTTAPRYTASSDILIENRDTLYTAPGKDSAATQVAAPEIREDMVQSQAQLVLARDAVLEVVRSLNLGALPEFDPAIEGPSALGRVLVMLRLASNPTTASPEDRVLQTFLGQVDAFPQRGSRIITIEASSEDAELAAKIANGLANEYMKREIRAKQDTAVQASSFLLGEINTLRTRVTEAEAGVETFRSQQGLLQGQGATTITTLQLSELSTQLASARSRQADLMARARLIRESLRNGRIFDVSEINNNELVRRLLEQRSTLRGQLALEERIYLPAHPRIKELSAQITDLEGQIRSAAERTARSLENDARTALARVEQLNADINDQKSVASKANDSEVQLRQMEREAKALRDQLETYLARYNDAQARDRENSVAADARIVSQAIVPSTPTFPKKLPIISIATLGTFFISSVLVLSGQLLGAATARPRRRHDNPPLEMAPQHSVEQQFAPPPPIQAAPVQPPPPQVFAQPAPYPQQAYPQQHFAQPLAYPSAMPVYQPMVMQPIQMPPAANRQPPQAPPVARMAQVVAPYAPSPSLSGMTLDARMVLEPKSQVAQAVSGFAAMLRQKRSPGRAACVVLAGDQGHAGTSSAAISLARVLVKDGKTILIDLHARKPGLNRILNDSNPLGLSNILANQASFADAIHRDRGSRAHVLPVGDAVLDPMQHPQLAAALDALSQTYDFMVIDGGLAGRQRAELLGGTDLALIVTQGAAQSVTVRSASAMLQSLGARNIKVLADDGSTLQAANTAGHRDMAAAV